MGGFLITLSPSVLYLLFQPSYPVLYERFQSHKLLWYRCVIVRNLKNLAELFLNLVYVNWRQKVFPVDPQ